MNVWQHQMIKVHKEASPNASAMHNATERFISEVNQLVQTETNQYFNTDATERPKSDDRAYQTDKLNSRKNLGAYFRTKDWEYYNDKSNEYVHLADGGLVDNQGLQSILNEFDTNGMINRRINHTSLPLNRLIIVNVNAGVLSEDTSGDTPRAPGVSSVLQTTMVASMDILSAKRIGISRSRIG